MKPTKFKLFVEKYIKNTGKHSTKVYKSSELRLLAFDSAQDLLMDHNIPWYALDAGDIAYNLLAYLRSVCACDEAIAGAMYLVERYNSTRSKNKTLQYLYVIYNAENNSFLLDTTDDLDLVAKHLLLVHGLNDCDRLPFIFLGYTEINQSVNFYKITSKLSSITNPYLQTKWLYANNKTWNILRSLKLTPCFTYCYHQYNMVGTGEDFISFNDMTIKNRYTPLWADCNLPIDHCKQKENFIEFLACLKYVQKYTVLYDIEDVLSYTVLDSSGNSYFFDDLDTAIQYCVPPSTWNGCQDQKKVLSIVKTFGVFFDLSYRIVEKTYKKSPT